jgi:hypothetical protein
VLSLLAWVCGVGLVLRGDLTMWHGRSSAVVDHCSKQFQSFIFNHAIKIHLNMVLSTF